MRNTVCLVLALVGTKVELAVTDDDCKVDKLSKGYFLPLMVKLTASLLTEESKNCKSGTSLEININLSPSGFKSKSADSI